MCVFVCVCLFELVWTGILLDIECSIKERNTTTKGFSTWFGTLSFIIYTSNLCKNARNKKILTLPTKPEKRFCNCNYKVRCLLNEKCLINNTYYQATKSSAEKSDRRKIYYRIAETTSKLRYVNHLKSFTYKRHKYDIELSNEYWRMKDLKKNTKVY